MAGPELYYLTHSQENFPSLSSTESSEADIDSLVVRLEAEYTRRSSNAVIVCDLSHNNLIYEHIQYLTQRLKASPIHLFALDLSWNRIFVPAWAKVAPMVEELLAIATHVDLAGNYLPALSSQQPELKLLLEKNVSFAAPNLHVSDPWVRAWTDKAHDFRLQAYRWAGGSLKCCKV